MAAHRRLRADAARNHKHLLQVAFETFAVEGVSVSIDKIAKCAGVGPGTIYRHFPTKHALFAAVLEMRLSRIVEYGHKLLEDDAPGEALSAFFLAAVTSQSGDLALVDAFTGDGFDVGANSPEVEGAFLGLLGELLATAQREGAAKPELNTRQIRALLVGCRAMQRYVIDPREAARLTDVVLAGIRP